MKKLLVISALLFVVVACSSTLSSSDRFEQVVPDTLTIFKSPTCGCCTAWGEHMEDFGYDVSYVDDLALESFKQELNIPSHVWSCHTTIVDGYFIEGHIPEEVVNTLLDEHPDIDGIAMAGMPSGSPGMPGPKSQDFVVYAVKDGRVVSEFARI